MFALLKQYRDLVLSIVLLLLPFAAYLSHAKQGRDLNPADRAVLAATAPIERGLFSAVAWVQDGWAEYLALRQVRHENLELRRQVLRLEEENLRLEEARQENERLREVLAFNKRENLPTLVAPVVGSGVSSNFQSITIARGERDGVRRNMAVVTPLGVVGYVRDVGPSSARVLVMSDLNAKIAVIDQKSRSRATVGGSGESKAGKLLYAERGSLFEDGDLLVTSGTDCIFPKGLAVGRVSEVDRNGSSAYLSAKVLSAVNFATVEDVLVITETPPGCGVALPNAQVDPALLKALQPQGVRP